ncbi:MBL fold metallo-hydrolase [Alicyclobacillus tolerans]|uniref:MBL fold metallo-hydrolase n=1 Tax=Alicyclobacillus tolerans TaxID=90970 RepID=UPI001F1A4140|nr:MBL fold metallo-hydrolase [Alicyclobacillus tolerans]MCF8564275.1 MBL fold metallo-hydrolase [Alicyclobacillus tolerans]
MSTRIVVTGTAQDAGIPSPGCSCRHCTRARLDPKSRRFPASIALISDSAEVMMVDSTPSFPEQWAMLGHLRLAGICLTHAHMGHYTGLMFLGREGLNSSNVNTYGTASMTRFLAENAPWSQLVNLCNIQLHSVSWQEKVTFGGDVEIQFFPVPHRAEYTDTAGVLIRGSKKTLVYIPDIDTWEGLDEGTAELIKKSDVALVDGTFYSDEELRQLSGLRSIEDIPHPTIQNSLEWFSGCNTQLVFTHLNHTNLGLDAKVENELKKRGARLAVEGDTFWLS